MIFNKIYFKNLVYICIGFSTLNVSACYNNPDRLSSTHDMLQQQPLKNDAASNFLLGNGIDTRTNFSTNRRCFTNQNDPNNITIYNPVGYAGLNSTMTTEEIAKHIGFELNGKGDFMWVSSELSAKYLKDSIDLFHNLRYE